MLNVNLQKYKKRQTDGILSIADGRQGSVSSANSREEHRRNTSPNVIVPIGNWENVFFN